ncbi:MAG TPA: hypothetical protein VHW70_12340 [Edaphobacter sp.]|jgi:hypothetical protein|nr:hypothetical protein [Edaphobacter sp.]
MNVPTRRTLLILGVDTTWALTSSAPIWKYLSHPKAITAIVLGFLSIALGMYWLDCLNRRQRQIGIGWFLLLFLFLTAAFAILYPISLKHTLNIGSDREDALRIELTAIHHHQYPYAARTFLGNPPTPLPGAMLLAAPFFAFGHIAWQNFLWLALFFLFTVHFFRRRATALFLLTVFLLCAPGNLSDFTSGGDYLINFFYVAIAITLFSQSLDRSFYVSIPAALFLGVTLSSRIIYPVILIPLLALALQQISRRRTVALFVLILLAAAVITLPFFTPHSAIHLSQQLNQSAPKLRYIPSALHPRWTLPSLAVLVSCIAFFVRMDLPRLFLIFSAATFIMLFPFVASFALHAIQLRYAFFYLSISALSFSLWALRQYERLSPGTPNPVNSI